MIVNELGPGRRLRGAAAPTCWPSSAASRSPRWRATRSPSCWPPGLTAVFALQVFVIVGGVTQRHPADRRDAALHLLRRLVDPGQLRAAGAAAADLRPRAARGDRAAMNAPIARLFVVVVRALRACSSASRRAGRCSTPTRCATTRKNHRELLEEQQIRRGLIRAADGTVLARSLKQRRRQLRAHAIRRAGCSPTPSATASCARAAPGSSASTTTTSAGAASELGSLIDRLSGSEQAGRQPASPRSTRPRSASRCSSSAGARAPSSRWTRARGAIKVMASVPGYDPNTRQGPAAVQRAATATRTPRCSTAPRRRAIRRARRSRSSPRSRPSTPGSYTPDSRISGAQRQDDLRRSPATTTPARPSATSPHRGADASRSTRCSARSARSSARRR